MVAVEGYIEHLKVSRHSTHRREGQVVQQLVRYHHPNEFARDHVARQFVRTEHRFWVFGALLSGAFYCDVTHRCQTPRLRCQHGSGQRPRAGSVVDDGERLRLTEAVPLGVERVGKNVPEERSHFGAGEKVASAACYTTARIEPVVRVIQGQIDERTVGKRAIPIDLRADQEVEWSPLNAQPGSPSNDTSATVSTRGGQTPNATVAKAVSVIAAVSDAGIRIGTMLPSGASSAHIVRSTPR